MKIFELLLEKGKKANGTYAGVCFSEDTKKQIKRFCKQHDIPHPVAPDKLHTTLLYSRKYLPDYKGQGQLEEKLIGKPKSWDIWKSQDGNNCLVLEYKCPELVERHEYLMDKYKATYDYPEYKTHVTFSYDVGKDFDVTELPLFKHDIEIIEEYHEDLDLEWAKSSEQ